MSVFFAFHLVDVPTYRGTLTMLKAAKRGDAAARANLSSRVRSGVGRCAAFAWNRDTPSMDLYARIADDYATGAAHSSFADFAAVAVCALALPLFQVWPRPGENESPNFASLAYGDGGFYELLSLDARVADVMASSHPLEPYPLGEGTVLLTRDDAAVLRDAAMAVELPSDDVSGDARETARRQLVRVMTACLDGVDSGVFYSVFP